MQSTQKAPASLRARKRAMSLSSKRMSPQQASRVTRVKGMPEEKTTWAASGSHMMLNSAQTVWGLW